MTHKTPSTRGGAATLLAIAAALFVLAAALAPVAAQVPSDSVMRGFAPVSEYLLEVAGKPVPNAEIYQNDRAILIITSALSSPVLVVPRSGEVSTVNVMKVAKQKDGTVDLLADAVLAPQGEIQLVDADAKFTIDAKPVYLKARPALLGLKQAADLKAYMPDYVRNASLYSPNAQAIAALKKQAKPATVRVYFGSWCPHCRQHVPLMLKVEDQLKGSPAKIKFEYFGLDRGMPEPIVKQLGLKGVPTGIVYIDGRQVGRLTPEDWDAPEVGLARILRGGGTQPASSR
jgi:thiol-disulfide isomerase/thioredoxin